MSCTVDDLPVVHLRLLKKLRSTSAQVPSCIIYLSSLVVVSWDGEMAEPDWAVRLQILPDAEQV